MQGRTLELVLGRACVRVEWRGKLFLFSLLSVVFFCLSLWAVCRTFRCYCHVILGDSVG